MPALRRARIGLDGEQILAHERDEDRLEFLFRDPGERGEARPREGLPEYRRVVEHAALRRPEIVEARCDQRVQRLGHLQRADRLWPRRYRSPSRRTRPRSSSIRTVSTARSGNTSARSRIRTRSSSGSPGTSPARSVVHRFVRERLEGERGEVAPRAGPARVPLRQLRPREREHEQRVPARPVEQVVDEVEQRRGPPTAGPQRRATNGAPPPTRSKNRRQAAKRSSRSQTTPARPRPSSCASRGSTHARSSSSGR